MKLFFKFAREMVGYKKRGRRRRRGTSFFIHFLLFQPNSRDSARPSASLRSESACFVVFVLRYSTGFIQREIAGDEHFLTKSYILALTCEKSFTRTYKIRVMMIGKNDLLFIKQNWDQM